MSTGWTTPTAAKKITLAIINRFPDRGQLLEAPSTRLRLIAIADQILFDQLVQGGFTPDGSSIIGLELLRALALRCKHRSSPFPVCCTCRSWCERSRYRTRLHSRSDTSWVAVLVIDPCPKTDDVNQDLDWLLLTWGCVVLGLDLSRRCHQICGCPAFHLINCPFDATYLPIFYAIAFAILDAGLHSALRVRAR